MTITCPRCGRANRSGAAFCAGCGQRLTSSAGGSAAPFSAELRQYALQVGAILRRLGERARQEAVAWYHDVATRQPEVVGEVVSTPSPATVTQTMQFQALLLPVTSQTTRISAISFSVRPHGGGPDQTVLMVGHRQGDLLQLGDRVRAWGVWDRDLAALRAWRVEVWERRGQPASYVVITPRPFPLAAVSALVLGFLLLSCLCSMLTR